MDPIQYFLVRGPVRGRLSRHRSEYMARRAVYRDRQRCKRLGGGAYSDAAVYAIHESGNMTGPYPFVGTERDGFADLI